MVTDRQSLATVEVVVERDHLLCRLHQLHVSDVRNGLVYARAHVARGEQPPAQIVLCHLRYGTLRRVLDDDARAEMLGQITIDQEAFEHAEAFPKPPIFWRPW